MSWSAIKWAMEASQHARLTTVQRVVLLTLAYHYNDRGGVCTPSNETLRAETGLSRRAVQVAVQALEANGLITVSTRTQHNIQTSNQYDLFRNAKGRTRCAGGGAGNGTAGAHVVRTNSYSPDRSTSNVAAFPVQRRVML
ncbi:helix-turn-helix domain-containing protein [Pseudorhodobacter aquimaris]|uniref:helix-turn-helix domain-containing protein n=1 Tax=Pseudorhodobacter aquimaris TaxID=687412 RepID=UPI00067B2850|nr:helix-turn-helix domain-containing protein [Pseudorhodobacter aquimaris]